MKIYLRELQEGPRTVDIDGSEEWLESICGWFVRPKGKATAKLTGKLTVSLFEEFVWVEGSIAYMPFVACDLCSKPLQISLNESVSRSYGLGRPVVEEKEKDLKSADLDEFYLAEDHLDLEAMLNEVVQLALPTANRHSEGDVACLAEKNGGFDGVLWTSETSSQKDSRNPFAALKELKIPAE